MHAEGYIIVCFFHYPYGYIAVILIFTQFVPIQSSQSGTDRFQFKVLHYVASFYIYICRACLQTLVSEQNLIYKQSNALS